MTLSRQLLRLTGGARLLVFLAMAAPILWTRDRPALLALAGIAVVWLVAQVCAEVAHLEQWANPVVEAALVGAICGLTLHSSLAVLAALALAPFVAGLRRGLTGVALATAAQLVVVVLLGFVQFDGLSADESLATFTWTVAGVGLGFIATFLRTTIFDRDDALLPYLEAQKPLRELIDIADDMRSGLDVMSLAGLVMSTVRDRVPSADLALYILRGEVLVPLITQSEEPSRGLSDVESLALESWARTRPLSWSGAFAFPVGDTAIIGGTLTDSVGLGDAVVEGMLRVVGAELRPLAVQLDTALLFAEFRDSATADVRKRLAREMHDGVAQDIASLGYLVDALAARPANPKQREQFTMLRDRITKIVGEVRQSVLTLRTSIGEAESLGTAISTVARHLSESSQIPIQVTLEEHSTRLRSEVEAELFRITQEAMNNAIKHAQCTKIDVHCAVKAPDVTITISDDGRGMQRARTDSHGLQIMQERARLVDAELSISDQSEGGLLVMVSIDTAHPTIHPTARPTAQ